MMKHQLLTLSLCALGGGALIAPHAHANPLVDFRQGLETDSVQMGDGPVDMALASFVAGPGPAFDLVTYNLVSRDVTVRLFDLNGGWLAPVTIDMGDVGFTACLTVADLDGNGQSDLIVTSQFPSTLIVRLAAGGPAAPVFDPPVVYTNVGVQPSGVEAGDLNGDGFPDVVVADAGGSSVSVLLNDGFGLGVLLPAVPFTVGNSPRQVAIGDVTGDGKPDILTTNRDSDNVTILAGDGLGGFTTHATIPVLAPQAIELADLDGDQDLDIVVSTFIFNSPIVSVLLNDGGGVFGMIVFHDVGQLPGAVNLRDFNGDGDIDIAVENNGDDTMSVLLNFGDGSFTPQLVFDLAPNGLGPACILSGDFDDDGLLDLAVSAHDTDNVVVLTNETDLLIMGDLDRNGVVDGTDLATLLAQWGSCTRPPCSGDLDCNNTIDGADLAFLLANWTDPNNPPPPLPGMMAPGAGDPSSTNLAPDDAGPNNQSQAPDVPWILAELGFTSVAEYVEWVDALTEAELFEHIQVLLQMIQQ